MIKTKNWIHGLPLNKAREQSHDFKNKYVMCLVTQSYPTLLDPIDHHSFGPPGSSVYGISQARILEWIAISFPKGDFPNLGIEPGSPALQVDSLPTELQGNPTNKYIDI